MLAFKFNFLILITMYSAAAGALLFQIQRMARHGLWLNVGMILGGLALSSAMVRRLDTIKHVEVKISFSDAPSDKL